MDFLSQAPHWKTEKCDLPYT
ncbi:hypothetical protein CGLO_14242 [Colletotrichum gloeosporioides Cg-14]|uniref:Uncharacterized protein n=1 Tax=Colletotrichum gloeosporioides (strain Cg-14) TaxID=1237896 RepID=T0L555_COLGC|nr:hypothetical protein CGLO_14242 [Colletotrichum gloeosporioides Cg-14]